MEEKPPMERWISEDLLAQIQIGILKPGVRLPSPGELADEYETTQSTAHAACQRLVDERMAERRGDYYFVAA